MFLTKLVNNNNNNNNSNDNNCFCTNYVQSLHIIIKSIKWIIKIVGKNYIYRQMFNIL